MCGCQSLVVKGRLTQGEPVAEGGFRHQSMRFVDEVHVTSNGPCACIPEGCRATCAMRGIAALLLPSCESMMEQPCLEELLRQESAMWAGGRWLRRSWSDIQAELSEWCGERHPRQLVTSDQCLTSSMIMRVAALLRSITP